ncbi:transposase [Candidatus Bipolaricaulota bacterium]|nr:transposase [Candidatus Bipolaricaulota bacterium]
MYGYEFNDCWKLPFIQFHEERYPDLADWLEAAAEEALTVMNLPDKHRKTLRTNKSLERLNEETKGVPR